MRRIYGHGRKGSALRHKVTRDMRDMRRALESDFPELMARIQGLLNTAAPQNEWQNEMFDKKKNLSTVLKFLEIGDPSPAMKREIEKSLSRAEL